MHKYWIYKCIMYKYKYIYIRYEYIEYEIWKIGMNWWLCLIYTTFFYIGGKVYQCVCVTHNIAKFIILAHCLKIFIYGCNVIKQLHPGLCMLWTFHYIVELIFNWVGVASIADSIFNFHFWSGVPALLYYKSVVTYSYFIYFLEFLSLIQLK